MTPPDLAAAFRCPDHIAVAMASNATPLLRAVRTIGPGRVRWIDGPAPNSNDKSQERSATCWALDGKRASQGELINAARGGR